MKSSKGKPVEFKIDLVDANNCPNYLRRAIKNEGIEI